MKQDGHVELDVPFPPGAHLTIFVLEADDISNDLLTAAESSLNFWDNALDDEDWNDA